jgi:dTDP-glucose pyrophosphorylase
MNFKLKQILISENTSIKKGMEALQNSSKKILCITNKKKNLLGVVNDGDIRRSILKNNNLDLKISKIMNKNPITVDHKITNSEIKKIMVKRKIEVIPILKANKIYRVITFDEIISKETQKVDVVINAGGLGTRLKPLTTKHHKTLIKVNKKPIINYILKNFEKQGYTDFKFILNHKADQVRKFLINSKLKFNFEFINEKKRLGTCGGLSLIDFNSLSENFILINCDIISGIDFKSLISFHKNNNSDLTIVTSTKKIKLKYGSIKNEGFNMLSLKEKPEITFMVNAGIYVINKKSIKILKKNQKFDIPEFVKINKNKNKKIKIYPTNEYWFDIGSKDDLEQFKKFINVNKKNL